MSARSAASPAPATAAGTETRTIQLGHPALPSVDVRIRRNRRTRHVRLHVDELGTVTASVPARFAVSRLDPIVRERSEWLHEVLVRMRLKARDTEVDLERGDPVRVLGQWLHTRVERASIRRPQVAVDGDRLILRVPHGADAHDVLLAWYRREARPLFESRVAAWASELGLQPGKVSVREQRTRWGSCTHRGDLSFNWRLVLAPLWVLDAIVVHELCHIDELNHSSRFWALLDERYPRHREASDWLREHGAALRITRPSPGIGATSVQPDPEPEPPADLAAPPVMAMRPRRRRGRSTRPAADQTSLF